MICLPFIVKFYAGVHDCLADARHAMIELLAHPSS